MNGVIAKEIREPVNAGRPFFVGQAPGRDGGRPLLGAAYRRFGAPHGMTVEEFAAATDRANLIPYWPGKSGKGDAFPKGEARTEACRLPLHGRHRVLLLGQNVASCFNIAGGDMLEWFVHPRGFICAVLPHPSGINRQWNDAATVDQVNDFMARVWDNAKERS